MSDIVIVGEAWGEAELEAGRPFVGPSGKLLRGVMRQAGLSPANAYLTNVFNLRPPKNDVENLCGPKSYAVPGYNYLRKGKYLRAEFQPELDRLFTELEEHDPNLIICLGATPLWAICKKQGIKKHRGYPMLSACGRWKVIATWHPAAVLRQFNLRPVLIADLTKAERESRTSELVRPRREIWIEPDLEDIQRFYDRHISGKDPALSVDIETANGQITEIGFAPDPYHSLVIPFYSRDASSGNYWRSHGDEVRAWSWVRYLLEHYRSFGQNFSYDMLYLWRTVGIPCPRFSDDTMLLHHSLHPELEKGLGFLASIYTSEPSWKSMRTDNKTLKKED